MGIGGGDICSKYAAAHQSNPQDTVVVDLAVRGLSDNIQADDLKKISGAKHVISSKVDTDSIRNVCTGTGRIKLRLAANEDVEIVKLQFLKAGFGVQEFSQDTKLKPNFT